jgi:hypothetical protein
MPSENEHISRLYLFVVAGLLAAATGYVYLRYGLGLGVGILAALTALAYWGLVSASPRVRSFVSKLFSSSV